MKIAFDAGQAKVTAREAKMIRAIISSYCEVLTQRVRLQLVSNVVGELAKRAGATIPNSRVVINEDMDLEIIGDLRKFVATFFPEIVFVIEPGVDSSTLLPN